MKVLHLTAGSLTGGAARGALWLHRALSDSGIDSTLLTNGAGIAGDRTVCSLAPLRIQRLRFDIRTRIAALSLRRYPRRQRWIFSTGFDGVDLSTHPLVKQADIVHLHWINGLVSLTGLSRIDKPVVWTLRDMWPFTGGCHYAMGCDRYERACGRCPQLGSTVDDDLSARVLVRKRESLPANLCVVPISDWLADCARDSSLFRQARIEMIHNCFDAEEFYPVDRQQARRYLGLPRECRVIALGAQTVQDFYKGMDLALQALGELKSDNLHLLIFGNVQGLTADTLPLPSTMLGFVHDTETLRSVYSAADVFIAPSRMEAFGKTLVESMGCGTPVVCFDQTGPAEIVDHQVTGYKARPFESGDLARGVEWVLAQDPDTAEAIRANSRQRALMKFSAPIAAQRYRELYQRLLQSAV